MPRSQHEKPGDLPPTTAGERLTGAAVARLMGMSRQAFSKGAKRGWYVADAAGLYDLEACRRAHRDNAAPGNGGKRPPRAASGGQAPRRGPTPKVPLREAPGLEAQVAATLDAEGIVYERTQAGIIPLVEVQRVNLLLAARKAQLDLAKQTEELVHRSTVRERIMQLATNDRENWRTWPADVATALAAELGVDETTMRVALQRKIDERLSNLRPVMVNL